MEPETTMQRTLTLPLSKERSRQKNKTIEDKEKENGRGRKKVKRNIGKWGIMESREKNIMMKQNEEEVSHEKKQEPTRKK